jgi:hypothetical protein
MMAMIKNVIAQLNMVILLTLLFRGLARDAVSRRIDSAKFGI